jgi:hypothetical protein
MLDLVAAWTPRALAKYPYNELISNFNFEIGERRTRGGFDDAKFRKVLRSLHRYCADFHAVLIIYAINGKQQRQAGRECRTGARPKLPTGRPVGVDRDEQRLQQDRP